MYLKHRFSNLSQEEPLGLDSCCASRRIFSMSPLWIEEDEGTCSSPPIRVSSLSGTTSNTCRVWLIPALEFIWSAAGVVTCTSVWAASGCVFPFSSSSTHEPGRHKVRTRGGTEMLVEKACCVRATMQTASRIARINTPLSPVSIEMADPYIPLHYWERCIRVFVPLPH